MSKNCIKIISNIVENASSDRLKTLTFHLILNQISKEKPLPSTQRLIFRNDEGGLCVCIILFKGTIKCTCPKIRYSILNY